MSELSPGYQKELAKERARRAALRERLAPLGERRRILFEAGCGHGHWLTAYAERFPDQTCVGIDLIADRIRRANAKRDKRGLQELYFFKAELNEFLDALPTTIRFDRIVFLFPDPWPKKRHHRRRMIQTALLDRLQERCDDTSRLYFRSDDRPYFDWTRAHIEQHPGWELDPAGVWPHETATYFQSLMDAYFSLVAKPASAPSPD